jgi:hypothetical protein
MLGSGYRQRCRESPTKGKETSMRKLFAAIFVGVALVAASVAPVAGAMKEDHSSHGFNGTENCSPRSEDNPFYTFGAGSQKYNYHYCKNA